MGDIVERLREKITPDAFEAGKIQSGILAERLLRERLDAADEIEGLRAGLAEARAVVQHFLSNRGAVMLFGEQQAALEAEMMRRAGAFRDRVT